jgi:hypothetical protein
LHGFARTPNGLAIALIAFAGTLWILVMPLHVLGMPFRFLAIPLYALPMPLRLPQIPLQPASIPSRVPAIPLTLLVVVLATFLSRKTDKPATTSP